jgi:hypothetical protein
MNSNIGSLISPDNEKIQIDEDADIAVYYPNLTFNRHRKLLEESFKEEL